MVVCLYCNSSIRVLIEGAETLVTLENSLDENELSEVKRLLLQGKRAEARTAYEAALAALPTETDASAQRYRELLKQKRDALAAVK